MKILFENYGSVLGQEFIYECGELILLNFECVSERFFFVYLRRALVNITQSNFKLKWAVYSYVRVHRKYTILTIFKDAT
jgi:hypothetical protein